MRRSVPSFLIAPLAAATLVACSSAASNEEASAPAAEAAPSVVATTSVLADVAGGIVECATGSRATVVSLMPLGTDPHDFSASSEQVAQMVGADLVVASGLGLESGLVDALATTAADGGRVLELGPLLDPIAGHADEHAGETHDEHAGEEPHADAHADEGVDPHWWLDMIRMATAAELIGAELADATGDTAFVDCGTQQAAAITDAEAQVRATLEAVPADRRVLVTDHEALGYLAAAYDFEIAGTVVPSTSTLAEPSSAELADLAAVIDAEGVPAIFANTAAPTSLAEAVAAETGREIAIVPLYVESLGEPGTPAGDYLGMMGENARLIADALR